jgi:hypothetical protein
VGGPADAISRVAVGTAPPLANTCYMPSTIAHGRYLSIGQLANMLGISKLYVTNLFDANYFKDSFRLPGSRDRRVPLRSAITFARSFGMVDAAQELERLAAKLGIPVAIRPTLALVSIEDYSASFAQFEVHGAGDLFKAGLLFGGYSYDAIVVSGDLGARECREIARHIKALPHSRTLAGILMLDDWSETQPWLDCGYNFAWKLPVDLDIVAGELFQACTSPTPRRKIRA